ncbi:MAG: hypothetical protein WBP92_16910, partial [Candidatus Acidiferrales bacterium]
MRIILVEMLGDAKTSASDCLGPIILSPLNGPMKMSPYEPGDISFEPERVATSGCDFILQW